MALVVWGFFCRFFFFFFWLASSEDYENLHCELIKFLLSIMLALVTFFFPLDVFRVHRGLGQES